jgi:serine/threonine protein kinase
VCVSFVRGVDNGLMPCGSFSPCQQYILFIVSNGSTNDRYGISASVVFSSHVHFLFCACLAGPLKNQAPERLLGLQCSFASDIYSLGLILRSLATGFVNSLAGMAGDEAPVLTPLGFKMRVCDSVYLPLKTRPEVEQQAVAGLSKAARSSEALRKQVLENNAFRDKWREQCQRFAKTQPTEFFSQELSQLIQACTEKNPRNRPTAKQILEHPFCLRCRQINSLSRELVQFLKYHKAKLWEREQDDQT